MSTSSRRRIGLSSSRSTDSSAMTTSTRVSFHPTRCSFARRRRFQRRFRTTSGNSGARTPYCAATASKLRLWRNELLEFEGELLSWTRRASELQAVADARVAELGSGLHERVSSLEERLDPLHERVSSLEERLGRSFLRRTLVRREIVHNHSAHGRILARRSIETLRDERSSRFSAPDCSMDSRATA